MLINITTIHPDRIEFILSPTIERLLTLTGLTDGLPRWNGEHDTANSL